MKMAWSVFFFARVISCSSLLSDDQAVKGSPDCPCIDHSGDSRWAAVIAGHVTATSGNCEELLQGSLDLTSHGRSVRNFSFPRDYGSGMCHTWDDKTELCRAKASGDDCGEAHGQLLEFSSRSYSYSWCSNKWCWVDPKQCKHRKHAPSELFAGLHYSYATCGNMDAYTEMRHPLKIKNLDVLRIGYGGEGYPGYCSDTTHPSRRHSCAFGKILLKELQVEEHKIIHKNVSALSKSMFKSSFTACVHDVAIGNVDLCMNGLFTTSERTLMTPFTAPLYMSELYLNVKKNDVVQDTFAKMMHIPFMPFSWELWGLILGVIIVTGFIMAILESDNEDDFQSSNPPAVAVKSLYLTALGYVSGGIAHSPKTPGGRIVALGYGFFLLICLASFTANTATFLLTQATVPKVASLDDAIRLNQKICILQAMEPAIKGIKPSAGPLLIGTSSWSELFARLKEGACSCVIADKGTMTDMHGKGEFCDYDSVGQPVVVNPVGMPVSEELNMAFSWIVTKERTLGSYARVEQEDPFQPSACPGVGKDGGDADDLSKLQLQPKNMLGTSMVLGFCILVGLLVRVVRKSKAVVEKNVSRPNLSTSEVVPVSFDSSAEATGNEAVNEILVQEADHDIKKMIREQVQLSAKIDSIQVQLSKFHESLELKCTTYFQ